MENTTETGKKSHLQQFPLRLPKSLKRAAKLMAEQDGILLNHFISLAIAEKLQRVSREHSAPIKAKGA